VPILLGRENENATFPKEAKEGDMKQQSKTHLLMQNSGIEIYGIID
jgi:hypothetical protein